MKIPSKYRNLLSNTGYLFIGTFGSKMISFVMLPFYTAWLNIEDFGTSDIINVYSTILLSIISLCISEAVFVIPTGRNKDDQKIFFSSSLLFGAFCILLLVLLYFTIHFLCHNLSTSFAINIGYITILCASTIVMSITQQFCKCINQIRIFASAGIINTLCVACLGFLLIKTYGINGYVASLVLANIITLLYVFLSAKLYSYVSLKTVSINYLYELLKYSIPLIPNSIIWLIVSYINRPIMEAYMGMAAIGLFSLANRFPTLITTVYNNFSNSWQISVLQEYGKDDYEKFYNGTCMIVFVGMSLCVSVMSIVIRPIIHLLFNENYYPAIDYIPWLCLSTPFMALASIVGANFSAIRQSKYFFYSSIWSAGSAVLINAILIPMIGLWGACIASVLSFVIGALSRIIYARKIVRFHYGLCYLIISVVTIVTLLLTNYTHTIIWSLLVIILESLFIVVWIKFLRINKSQN